MPIEAGYDAEEALIKATLLESIEPAKEGLFDWGAFLLYRFLNMNPLRLFFADAFQWFFFFQHEWTTDYSWSLCPQGSLTKVIPNAVDTSTESFHRDSYESS